jgi:MFS family permease
VSGQEPEHRGAQPGDAPTAPVDPVEGGRGVEEAAPVRRGRGWTIDTTSLRNPAFRRLFWGVAATMLGQQMTLVAVPFQVYELTGSSLLVGVTSMVGLVPLVVFGLLGGAIADAMDRRRLMLITSVGAAVTSALLALQALLPGGGNLALLWVLTAFVSAFAAVNQPTRSAVIPALVGPSNVAAANALTMTVRQAGVIVGPLIAGVLIGLGDVFIAYAVDALGFVVAAVLVRGLPPLLPGGALRRLRLGSTIRGVADGFAFLRTQPVLLMTFVIDIIAMTFAWPQAVFPELAETRFEGSPNSLGWLFAGVSMGALIMGLTSGWVTRIDRQGAVVLAAVAVWGVAIIGFGLAPTLWLAVLCLAVAGAGDMVSSVLRNSILLMHAPEEMRGRMQGVFIVVVTGGPRLGDLRAGALASAAGVSVAMVSGGVVVVVAMAVLALAVPSFWLFRASRSARPSAAAGEARPASPAPESGEARPDLSAS